MVDLYDISYMEAIIEYSRIHDIELEALAEVVSQNEPLKQALLEEASGLRMIKVANTAKLPQI